MRILIIDDQIQFLNALAAMLMPIPEIEAVCSAHGGHEGLKFAAEMNPDIVLTDFSMPDLGGMDVARRLKASSRPPKVIMMSFHAEQEYRQMARDAGVDAYVVKSDLDQELVPILRWLAPEATHGYAAKHDGERTSEVSAS